MHCIRSSNRIKFVLKLRLRFEISVITEDICSLALLVNNVASPSVVSHPPPFTVITLSHFCQVRRTNE